MQVIRSVSQMQRTMQHIRQKGKTIGFVPTMGALHAGHMSLVNRARKAHEVVVVSLFVNPAQFGPHEDYLKYPRPFARDAALCRSSGVDYLFVPTVAAMYPAGYHTYITVEQMSTELCGVFRPGHFRGVATVVAKLFNIVLPDAAYLGLKDYQQVAILKRMVADLNIPVKLVACPTVRERTGLALSSRNQYLSATEKVESAVLHRALSGATLALKKRTAPQAVVSLTKKYILKAIPAARIDYIAINDAATLAPVSVFKGPVVIAVAVWVGKARLIDNITVRP